METQSKQEFSAAVAKLQEEENKLGNLIQRKWNLEAEAVKLLEGELNFRDIDDNALSRRQTEEAIENQKLEVKKAEELLELARIKMAEAVMERKTYDRLREKAFEEFVAEENRAEGKIVDELTSYTHVKKIK